MRAFVKKLNKTALLLGVSFFIIMSLGAIMFGRTYAFNSVLHQAGDDEYVRYEVYGRGGATDTWIKESKTGKFIKGKIFEISISNYSAYQISDWNVRIDIDKDCWINNAWNGEVEIHQNVNNGEKVQIVNLLHMPRDFEIDLEHEYDAGDLLVKLYKGDYVIYRPNKELYEDPILSKNGHLKVGLIFYTVAPGNMSISTRDTSLTYKYHTTITEEIIFMIWVFFCVGWVLMLTAYLCSQLSLGRKKEIENKAALEAALEDARRANEAKSQFLATVSHEIRTPINAMLGMNTMILRECKQEEIRQYAKDINSSGHTLLMLINDILDLSKIESGKMEIIPNEYNICDVIKEVYDMIKPKAREKGLDLFIDIDENTPEKLYGDDVRIRQIILNIFNNAVKYTKRGSVTLKVNAEFVNDEKIILHVLVKDTGIGIKEEDISKLFASYERLDEEKNRNIEGTGLGLNITNRLLRLMGSSLEVISEYGRGSEFSFELIQKVISFNCVGKVDFEDNTEAVSDESEERFHAPTANILVVDDVKMNLVVFENLLKRVQCRIDTCESGREALALAKRKKYDIIFIDHMMPNMDGIDVLNIMKEECDVNKYTPKVVLTANAISGAREEYLEAGFDNYLSKPVDGVELENMIMHYIPESKIENVREGNNNAGEFKYEYIDDLDIDEGIKHSGSKEMYEKILKIFAESSFEEDANIKQYADDLDYDNYTVEAHGIKSSAKTIGAKRLASIAFEMEMAGKLRDRKKILEDTPKLIDEHKRLAMDIARIG